MADAVPAIRLAVCVPFLTALGAFPRGVLVKNDSTVAVYQSMGLHILTLGLGLALGILVRGIGVNIAALALSAGLLVEFLFLQVRARALSAN